MGRPSLFNETLTAKIIALYEQGKTDREVADIIGISERAINYWKAEYPDFLQSVKQAKSGPDDAVEHALFCLATGYTTITYEETERLDGTPQIKRTEKQSLPSIRAIQFWLKNRKPENWNDSNPEESDKQNNSSITPAPKKSYEEFVEAAGYPKPFPKQIEMFNFAFSETVPRLLLGARGTGKTDYITLLGVAYDIYLNGSTNLIVTKSKSRNSAILSEIASALKKNGVKLMKENSSCINIEGHTGKDHNVEALTIKASIRGRHPDRTVMDDPVTEEDVSEAMRTLVKTKYNEIMKLCTNVCVIGQPAHKFDLYADLRGIIKKLEVPHGCIPEIDHDIDAQRAAGVDESSIQASYFLKIINEGNSPFDKIRYVDKFPTGESAVAFIDPSFEGGDYTAISIVKAYMQGVAVVGFTYKKAWNHCLDELAQVLHKYNVRQMCFETNSLGTLPLDVLRARFGDIGVVGKKSNTNKHSRITGAGTIAEYIHLSKESDKIYQDQVVKYEYKAKHDDAPDSLASCLEWIGLIRGKL